MTPPPRKKLIEVALPLEAINVASAREKGNPFIKGHPRNLHHWWARRPLAACRAVLFSSLVDDPSADPHLQGYTDETREHVIGERREQLHALIRELVKWENSTNDLIINAARAEIARTVASRKLELDELKKDLRFVGGETVWDLIVKGKTDIDALQNGIGRLPQAESVNAFLAEHAPHVLDPFCGGGSIPLEAQRLGLVAHGSDLNPVAVLNTKALIEIPPKFAGNSPINPDSRGEGQSSKERGHKSRKGKKAATSRVGTSGSQGSLDISTMWRGAAGLAADVRYYGRWMRDEAEKRIGHLYPRVKITNEMAKTRRDLKPYAGQELTVIAWIWVRTVASPNPVANGAHVPLVRSYWLSTKAGKKVWARPVIDRKGNSYHFEIQIGEPDRDFDPDIGTVSRNRRVCLLSDQPMALEYVRAEGMAGRLGQRLLGIVAEGKRERLFVPPTDEHERIAASINRPDILHDALQLSARYMTPTIYGLTEYRDLYTPRQLYVLNEFVKLVQEVHHRLLDEFADQREYVNALALYLSFAVSQLTRYCSSLAKWNTTNQNIGQVFGLNALPFVWDFAEANVASGALDLEAAAEWVAAAIEQVVVGPVGHVTQGDARHIAVSRPIMIATDPPYYDNVPYADLSDYFYVWLRLLLQDIAPDLVKTMLAPKADELVADPLRQGGRAAACQFFEVGMSAAFQSMRDNVDAEYPATIYYAFKQTEDDDESGESLQASTGWETLLEALITTGWEILGTWPVRTERQGRLRETGSNALASSIVLVCRPRPLDASLASRKEFIAALKRELPEALHNLQSGNIAPVDLAQAAIGPGMAVFSRYSKVLETSGERMGVRPALAIINQMLDEVLSEQEGEYDSDTRWAIKWFEQYAHDDGPYGDAETLCKAMAVGVNGLVDAGIVASRSGKVRLLKRAELPADWDPATDNDICHWEVCQHLIRRLDDGGEQAAGELLRKVGGIGEIARDLAYRLYTVCERKKWAQEAISYNTLVVAWPEIQKLAMKAPAPAVEEETLYSQGQRQ